MYMWSEDKINLIYVIVKVFFEKLYFISIIRLNYYYILCIMLFKNLFN